MSGANQSAKVQESLPSVGLPEGTDRKALNLWQKLALIAAQVRNIPKRGFNAHFQYHFVQATDVNDVVGHMMGALGVVMVPKSIKVLGEWETRSGKVLRLRFTWEFINADAPTERERFHSLGEGQDSGDKCSYKGTTGASKYALISFFKIPTGLDPEREDSSGGGSGQGKNTRDGKGSKSNPDQQGSGKAKQEGGGGQAGAGNAPRAASSESAAKTEQLALKAKLGPHKGLLVDTLTTAQIQETIDVGLKNAADPQYAEHKEATERHVAQLRAVLSQRLRAHAENAGLISSKGHGAGEVLK